MLHLVHLVHVAGSLGSSNSLGWFTFLVPGEGERDMSASLGS